MRENLTGLHSLHLNQTEPLWDVRIRQKKEARKYVVLKGNSWRKIVQRISSTVILVSYMVGYKKSILDTQIVSDFEYLIIYSTRNNQESENPKQGLKSVLDACDLWGLRQHCLKIRHDSLHGLRNGFRNQSVNTARHKRRLKLCHAMKMPHMYKHCQLLHLLLFKLDLVQSKNL